MNGKVEATTWLVGHIATWVMGTTFIMGEDIMYAIHHKDNFLESIVERLLIGFMPDHGGGGTHIMIFGDYPLVDVLTSLALLVSIIMMAVWTYMDLHRFISTPSDRVIPTDKRGIRNKKRK